MNPSRITTPLDKKIDEWWFRYLGRALKFDIYLHRVRDIEAEASGQFESHFYAVANSKCLEKLAIKEFPAQRVQAPSFEELRNAVAKHVNDWLNAIWEKVIVVYLEESTPQTNFDNTRVIYDQNAVKFEHIICYRSKDGRFWKKPDSTFVSSKMTGMICTCGHKGSFQALPYSDELEESLKVLAEKLRTLACGLRSLVFERTEDFVTWARQSPQNLLNA